MIQILLLQMVDCPYMMWWFIDTGRVVQNGESQRYLFKVRGPLRAG